MLKHLPHGNRGPGKRDGGYIMALFGLVLIALVAFAGIGIDIASWYARASSLQRGADAAALACAAQMPNFTAGQAAATETAQKNGFVSSSSITITTTSSGEHRCKVVITDKKVPQYFSRAFRGDLTLTRSATAEYVLPIPLGSPTNFFGNDPVGGQSGVPVQSVGLWGNIHGPETDNFKGDRFAPSCRGNSSCSGNTNLEYRPEGYIYTLDIPAGAGKVILQVYDAGLYPRANEQTETGDTAYNGNTSTNTVWKVYGPNSSALDNSLSNPLTSSQCYPYQGGFTVNQGASASTYQNKWVGICQLQAPSSGTVRYRLQVRTTGNGDGANRYALRASYTGTVNPQLSAYGDMSMFNNQLTTNPNFYLAKVDDTNKGKTMVIYLYDPGEIAVKNAYMKIMNPQTGAPASSCILHVYNNPKDSAPSSTQTLNGSSGCKIATTDGSGNGLYNGKLLAINITIPSNYSCNAAQTNPGCWWKILYDLGTNPTGNPQDTTTWSAAIIGDPVHLVNDS